MDTTTRTLRIVKTLAERVADLERRLGAKPALALAASLKGLSPFERTCRLVDAGLEHQIVCRPPPTRARRPR